MWTGQWLGELVLKPPRRFSAIDTNRTWKPVVSRFGEAQVSPAHFRQLTTGAQAGEWERWVFASSDNQR